MKARDISNFKNILLQIHNHRSGLQYINCVVINISSVCVSWSALELVDGGPGEGVHIVYTEDESTSYFYGSVGHIKLIGISGMH